MRTWVAGICTYEEIFILVRNFDVQMYQHFVAYLAKEHKVDICESVKKQVRLLAGCERLKTLLSTASTTQSCSIQVENLGNDCDITLTMSRYGELCH